MSTESLEGYMLTQLVLNEASLVAIGKEADLERIPAEVLQSISSELTAIAKLQGSKSDETHRGTLGSVHLNFNKWLATSLVTGVAFCLTIHGSDHVTVSACAAEILVYLGTVRELLSKLTPFERKLYEVIASIARTKASNGRVLEAKGVSLIEIEQELTNRHEEFPSAFKDALDDLIHKGVISRSQHEDGTPRVIPIP